MAEKKERRYVSDNAQLMAEWNWEKNIEMNPYEVAYGSHKKAWWKCASCGNEWMAEVKSRAGGTGCPNCKGKKISNSKRMVKQNNSLYDCFPDIAKEWHPTKNGTITPRNVNCGTSDKYWWKCKYGHEWEASVSNRTGGHTNCPKCSGERHTSFPEQAVFYFMSHHFRCENRYVIQNREIDIYIPDLKIGIEYDGRYYHPKLSRSKEERKDEFFRSIGISIIRIKEDTINRVEPACIRYIYSTSHYRHLDWAISELFKMFNIDEQVDVESKQSDIIANYIKSIKENSLQSQYPELAEQWDVDANKGVTPDMVSVGSKMIVFWRCTENHLYRSSINERVRYHKQGKSFGCPYCSGHKVLQGFNDLQTIDPILAQEWDQTKNGDITPSDITSGSSKKYWWICHECGNSWSATVANRTQGRGCPKCKPGIVARKLTSRAAKKKTFADAFPELVCEWDNCNTIKPNEVAPRSNIKVNWVCSKCGHKWITSVSNRTSGYNCKECYLKNRTIHNKQAVTCVETGERFESIAAASQKKNISRTGISNCLSGRAKSAGGYHWAYIDTTAID